jgi:hypothetical protein
VTARVIAQTAKRLKAVGTERAALRAPPPQGAPIAVTAFCAELSFGHRQILTLPHNVERQLTDAMWDPIISTTTVQELSITSLRDAFAQRWGNCGNRHGPQLFVERRGPWMFWSTRIPGPSDPRGVDVVKPNRQIVALDAPLIFVRICAVPKWL